MEGGVLPNPYLKIDKKYLDFFEKIALIALISDLNFPFQMQFLAYLGKKLSKFFPVSPSFGKECCK